jgi:undecaprenyl diphosphate synthase
MSGTDPPSDIEALKGRLDSNRLPAHVAIIMDGNGRWAHRKGLPRLEGHRRGYGTTRQIVRDAGKLGIRYLTLYVFSVENWKRPKHETDALMHLIEKAAASELPELNQNGVRMRFLGRRERLSESLQRQMDRAETLTAGNTGLTLNLAINYGGRTEIVDAVHALMQQARDKVIDPDDVDESAIARHLYAPDMPDPDLMIRTAGEMRVSNFLLWEIAYAELWVTQTLWPDFTTAHLVEAIIAYQSRIRKFGTVVGE